MKISTLAASVVSTLAAAEVAADNARNMKLTKGGESAASKVRTALKGRNSPVTEAEWNKDWAPAFRTALNAKYGEGKYGPRLTWLKVMVLGISAGLTGRAGLRQYYEDVLPQLTAKGIVKRAKAGRPKGTTSGKPAGGATPNAVNKANAAGADKNKRPLPQWAPGKSYTEADMRQAALILFGSPAFAAKLVTVARDADMTAQIKKAVTSILAA